MTRAEQVAEEKQPVKRAALLLGPGFITGAADDDPSGIGTYAVAGASLGLATLWTALLTFPFMAAVQTVCARLGQVSGTGLAGILKEVNAKNLRESYHDALQYKEELSEFLLYRLRQ